MKNILTGWEVREQYKNGRRDFSNVEVQWADFSGTDLSDINFSNSKLSITTFFRCNLENANFSDCDIYATSFNSADLSGATFDKSKLNWIRFDNAIFKNTSMRNATVMHVTLINCNTAGLKIDNTSQFNVFRTAEEIPDLEVERLLLEIGNIISKVDLDRKLWVKTGLGPYLKSLGKQQFSTEVISGPYSKSNSEYSKPINLYKGLDNTFIELIETYGPKNPYKKEGKYKAKGKY